MSLPLLTASDCYERSDDIASSGIVHVEFPPEEKAKGGDHAPRGTWRSRPGKTRQDKMADVNERPRVQAWKARKEAK